MKLEGSLDAFGLPDIFQLLSLTKKTGGLQLRSGASAGVVYFAGGSVTGADCDLSRQMLARRLVGVGGVGDDVLEKAIARAKNGQVGVTRALLDAGAVDADVARAVATDVTVDAVFELLAWPDGDFAFAVDAVNPDDLGVVLTTEHVVAQAAARQELLDAAADVVPSGDLVFSLATTPGSDPELSREEWSLLALADGRRTVTDIVDVTGRGYFAVVPGLAGLVRRGLLEARADGEDPAESVRRRLELLRSLEGAAAGPHASVRTAPAPRPAAVASPPADAVSRISTSTETSAAPPAEPAQRPVVDEPEEQASELVSTIGGPHLPTDVVPPRPEPFLAKRQPEHPEEPVETRPAAAASVPARLAFAPAAEPGRAVFSQPAASSASDGPRAGGSSGGGAGSLGVGGTHGSAAMAADPEATALIERDPSVNRSLLLRLIAGVRGL